MESLVVSVTVPSSEEDAVVGFLCDCGSIGVEVQNFDAEQVILRAFFPSERSPHISEVLRHLASRLPESSRDSLAIALVPDEDWMERWRQSLSPFRVGNSFLVIPTSCDTTGIHQDGRTRIFIEPGMAFGTGTHESTQLCLRALETMKVAGKAVLDVGTGAGILSIAAVLLGAKQVWACDVDATATRVAMENFALNQVSERVRVWTGSLNALHQQAVDIGVANLTARIFERLWPDLERTLPPGSHLICSGILREQEDDFKAQMRQHRFAVEREDVAGDWVGIVARKDAGP
jgi:ribosomal protein L11 methyltransferase